MLYIPTVLSVWIYCGNEEWETANLYHTVKCISIVFLELRLFADVSKTFAWDWQVQDNAYQGICLPLALGDVTYGLLWSATLFYLYCLAARAASPVGAGLAAALCRGSFAASCARRDRDLPAVARHIGVSRAGQFAPCGWTVTAALDVAWIYGCLEMTFLASFNDRGADIICLIFFFF